MKHTIAVAAVQVRAHDREALGRAWDDTRSKLGAALDAGARIAVLPEATLPGYVMGYEPFDPAAIERQLQDCSELAARYEAVVVIGSARANGAGVFNSALVIDTDGSVAGSADKNFLWHFDRQWFTPGASIQPVRTRVATIGALVCADGRIPTIASTLVDRGAQILVMPTAWVTSGRDPQNLENAQADLLARVRARENAVPFVAANKCGTERASVAYCGKSQIVSAGGEVLALAAQHDAETIVAQVEIGEPVARPRAIEALEVQHRIEPARIAITASGAIADEATMLRILEAQELIGPDAPALGDAAVLDPRPLAAARLTGATLAVWKPAIEPPWQVTFARARALELRMYVIVIDAARDRAYAVDPDGAVICGTYDGLRVASFAFDPQRVRATAVAPNTDVLDGLARAANAAR